MAVIIQAIPIYMGVLPYPMIVCVLRAHQQSKVVYSSNNGQLSSPLLLANNVVQSSINDCLVNEFSALVLALERQ